MSIDPIKPSTTQSHSAQFTIAVIVTIAIGFLIGRWIAEARRPSDLIQARELVERSSVEAAVSAYQKHLQGSPGDAEARLELARLLQKKDPEGALRELRQISPQAEQFNAAARLVAGISMTLDRDYDALGPLKLLAARLPGDDGVQQALAEIYFRQKEFARSLEHSTRSRELRPGNVATCLLVAEAKDSLGLTSEMIEPLEAALRLDPELPQAHLNLAYALEATGKADDALPHVKWFLERFPSSVPANRILAMIQRSQGHYPEALTSAEAAMKLAPGNLDCAMITAELMLYLRRPKEAYDILNRFAADRPYDRRLLTPLLRAAMLSGQTDRAKEIHSQLQTLESGK